MDKTQFPGLQCAACTRAAERLSVLIIPPIGCSRMLSVPPLFSNLKLQLSRWRSTAQPSRRPFTCRYLKPARFSLARAADPSADSSSSPRSAALWLEITSSQQVIFIGQLSPCAALQRQTAGCAWMEGCRHGLHQENKNFGVHMRDPEWHDQHHMPPLCGMGD